VPEHPCPADARSLPEILVGHWCAWRGAIYYQGTPLEEPADQQFAFAAESVGLTLYDVHDVLITGVTFRHFRLDGINAADQCRNILIENVSSIENGRAGLAVGGTSQVVMRGSKLLDNRRQSLLVTEFGIAQLDETEVSQPPAVEK
jgi:hypothetical protein